MKTKHFFYFIAGLFCIFLAVSACSQQDAAVKNVNSYTLDVSQDYQYNFGNNDMVKLGRVLFYDQSLSINNAVSCGSCHKQGLAFADNQRFSTGFEGKLTDRNTPPIQNLGLSIAQFTGMGFGQALFWDGRERVLGDMVMQPMFNHVEMGMRNPTEVVNRVKSKSYYPELFAAAFSDGEINVAKVSEALTSFVMSISSSSSSFDHNFRNATTTIFSPSQERGFQLFFGKYNCGSCHQLFSSSGYSVGLEGDELLNIGLDATYTDNGFGGVTKNVSDNGKFKIPNLRNVALTPPYMHDGRFKTLEEVINHYSKGVQQHPNLDFRLKDESGNALVLNISEEEKEDLIAFLHTLTDNELTTDPKFSNPFKAN